VHVVRGHAAGDGIKMLRLRLGLIARKQAGQRQHGDSDCDYLGRPPHS